MKKRIGSWYETVTESLLLTAMVIVVVGVGLRWLGGQASTGCLLRVELAGSRSVYEAILKDKTCSVDSAAVVSSLGHDVVFIFAYMIGLWLVCMIGARAFVAGAARATFKVAAWCAVVAGVFDWPRTVS